MMGYRKHFIGFFSALLLLFVVTLPYRVYLEPMSGEEGITFRVDRGESARQIARRLKEAGIIRSEKLFLFLVKLTGNEDNLQAGVYRFRPKTNEYRVLLALTGQARGRVDLRLTVYEGMTLWQIAATAALILGADSARFLALTRDPAFILTLAKKFPQLDSPSTLEGYLYPDTYFFQYGTREEEIIETMVERFFQLWTPDLQARADSLGWTLHQVVTLASMIEAEAMVDWEKPYISSVFHNRLRLGIPLASSPTLLYVMPRRKPWLTYADLALESPYNTYKHPGLPPGPICSPGIQSIRAALYPKKTSYLYFVAKGDGTHYFSTNWEQHERYKRRVRHLFLRRG